MPVEVTRNFGDVELAALFAYLQALPPTPIGRR